MKKTRNELIRPRRLSTTKSTKISSSVVGSDSICNSVVIKYSNLEELSCSMSMGSIN